MGEKTGIPWADKTWNPWQGCTKVSPGCDHCYMYRAKRRYGQKPERVHHSSHETFGMPYKWARKNPGSTVFTCSWSDFFHPAADEWREEAWDVIARTPMSYYLILTKRPERVIPPNRFALSIDNDGFANPFTVWPWPNVAIGVTAENQEEADRRIPILLDIPAAMKFVSVEPMLGPVDLTRLDLNGPIYDSLSGICIYPDMHELPRLDWVICGGETGPNARPMHPDWVRSLRDQCQAAGTPFFFKQWGEWTPRWGAGDHLVYRDSGKLVRGYHEDMDAWKHGLAEPVFRVGKSRSGHELDGREWREFPRAIIEHRER